MNTPDELHAVVYGGADRISAAPEISTDEAKRQIDRFLKSDLAWTNKVFVNRDATIQLHDVLVSRGINRTLTEVDNAIDSAQVTLSHVNGWEPVRQIDYNSFWWDEIIEDVCESLDLAYDEVVEVAE